jgi:hypothetical protein
MSASLVIPKNSLANVSKSGKSHGFPKEAILANASMGRAQWAKIQNFVQKLKIRAFFNFCFLSAKFLMYKT